MNCCIVRDLLANYIDGLCSGNTNDEIKKHLDDCSECRAIYRKMSEVIPREIPPKEVNVDFLKKLKARILRKNIIVAVSTLMVVLAVFFIFAKNYEIPLPFDANRMSVELFKAVVVTGEDGTISLEEIDPELFGDMIPEDSSGIIDAVWIAYRGINNISQYSTGRTIKRNGQDVRVVYHCYTKTLWDSLFVDSDLLGYSESGRGYGSDIYGDSYESGNYEPQMKEIYYLPIRNFNRIDNLSDEEFDRLKEKCDLIWSGIA